MRIISCRCRDNSKLEAAASLVLGALRGGSSILLSAGGLTEVVSVHGEGRRRLLSTLAAIWWEAPDRLPPVPADRQTAGRNTCVLLFSSPGSHGLDPLLRAMRGRGWRITVVLSDITAPAAPAAPFAALSRAQAESFRALLDAGVVRAKSCLGEAGDVRVV